jgi:hypothetical protein
MLNAIYNEDFMVSCPIDENLLLNSAGCWENFGEANIIAWWKVLGKTRKISVDSKENIFKRFQQNIWIF